MQIECLVNLQRKAFVDKRKGFAEFAFLHTQAFAEFTADFVFVRTLLLVFYVLWLLVLRIFATITIKIYNQKAKNEPKFKEKKLYLRV